MNSIERVMAALTFGRADFGAPDRVPVFPVPLMQGALVYNCTVAEYFGMSAERIAEAQITINKMFDGIPDGLAGIPNVIEDVTAFGVGLEFKYPNSSPCVSRMRIRNYEEIGGLTCPSPLSSPQLHKTLEVISTLSARMGREKVVIGAAIAPFSLPSMLMGTSKWMRLLFTPALRDKYLRRTLDVCAEFVVDWSRQQHKAGAHVVILADGMASSTILPRGMFEQYALPVIRDVIRRIGGPVAYEPVGRMEPFADLLADIGALAILIGSEDDIPSCKKAVRDRVALIGNINNMKLRRWSPARIELQARAALQQGMSGYGFILANQGPEIPFDVSVEGIGALIRAVDKYGHYAPGEAGVAHAAATAM
ncbi:MAG: uroporphyrinogen decarboxylase family protein [Phycisphaerales bacterium]|nr:uroporphyrinogen decarboxylase family protein [Phycisphaerales bacterium]